MSSFMISVEGMNNIINGLYFDNRLKEYYPDLYREQNLETDDDFYKLARKLFLLSNLIASATPGSR